MIRVIYGAGNYGSIMLDYCHKFDIAIDFFVQTNKPNLTNKNGIRIISIDELFNIEDKIQVLLSIKSIKDSKEIKEAFVRYGRKDIEVFDMKSFIEDNMDYMMGNIIGEGNRFCLICKHSFSRFNPGGEDGELFHNHHIIGGGFRECKCPFCESWDRDRWIYYVIKNKTNIPDMTGRILHFAPEEKIKELIEQYESIDYYSVDIIPGRAMHVADITDIQFKDETFDYVICNHVMEHIVDEKKAVSEIRRVLKKDGKWIFSFPICTDMNTYENKDVVSADDRLKQYGQEDHVRLYGTDYKARFERYGFKIKTYSPIDEFDTYEIRRNGMIEDDTIIIAEKADDKSV